MVIDHYQNTIPWDVPWIPPIQPIEPLKPIEPVDPEATKRLFQPLATKADIDELIKLLKDFRKAEAAAKVVDELTGQKDCVDPEKAKLLERVAQLEKEIEKLRTKDKPRKTPKRRKK